MKYLILLSAIFIQSAQAGWFSPSVSKLELSEWLASENISENNLDSKQKKHYRNQIENLKDSNYELSSPEVSEVIETLVSTASLCDGRDYFYLNNKKESIYKYDDALMAAVSNNKDDISEACLHTILQDYMKLKAEEKTPSKLRYCKKRKCTLTKQYEDKFAKNLEKLIFLTYGSKNHKTYCSEKKDILDIDDIQDLIGSFEKVNKCKPLAVGGVKVVNDVTNSIKQRYSLKRTSDNSYKATFNLDFGDMKIKDSKTGEWLGGDYMRDKINQCLKDSNEHMKGPDGRKLELEIISKEDADKIPSYKRPPLTHIALNVENARANSGTYPIDMSCPTTIHELLHLAGLHDEYEETVTGLYVHTETGEEVRSYNSDSPAPKFEDRKNYKFTPDFNHCRAISEEPSIMAQSTSTYRKAIPPEQGFACECDEKKEKYFSKCSQQVKDSSKEFMRKYIISTAAGMREGFYNPTDQYYSSCKIDGSKTIKKPIKNEADLDSFKYFSTPILKDDTLQTVKSSIRFSDDSDKVGEVFYFTQICKCGGDDKLDCSDFKEKIDGVIADESKAGANSCGFGFKKVEVGSEDTVKDNQIYIKPATNTTKKKITMLRRAHFEKIVQGSCDEKVKKYTECGKYWGVRLDKTCPERPDYCKDEALWLDSI